MSRVYLLLFLITTLFLQAEDLFDNSNEIETFAKDTNQTTMDEQFEPTGIDELDNYNFYTSDHAYQESNQSVKSEVDVTDDVNNTNNIGVNTKLDDVSGYDIVKAQRKQRKIKREERIKEEKKEKEEGKALLDIIVVSDSVLQGQIEQLTSEYLQFRTVYGQGSIRIKYSDIDQMSSEHRYHIYFDGKETDGKITAIKEHAFLEVEHGNVKELVTISKIDRFVISTREDNSFENQLRNLVPYWSGYLDIGMEYESGSSVKNKIKIASKVSRKKTIYRSVIKVDYAYETTKTVDTPLALNKDELFIYGEHDVMFSKSSFGFVQMGYDYDKPRGIKGRVYPAVGYGYRIGETRQSWVLFKGGTGYVYEDFFGPYPYNHYVAAFAGIEARYTVESELFLNNIVLDGMIFYMPSLKDPTEHWLARYQVSAEMPIGSALSLKLVAKQVNDDNPDPAIGNNKLTVDFYLSLRF